MRRFQWAETIGVPLNLPFGLGAHLTVTIVTITADETTK